LRETLGSLPWPPAAHRGLDVLDIGCGEGFYLGTLAGERRMEAHGIDLSASAVDLAARRYPAVHWFVVNADRGLPYADASLDLALSLTSRRNAPEVRRVLRPEGHLIVAVPGEDDLLEPREAVLGDRVRRNRVDSVLADFAPFFTTQSHRTLKRIVCLSPTEIRDALAATYRGARDSERQRLAALGTMDVTLSYELFLFSPLP